MILRKPYAFLIKYFQKINFVLLLLVGFIFYKNIKLIGFTNDYLSTAIYNNTLDSISNYINGYVYLVLVLVMIITIVLAYLLRYKDKPYASYIVILIVNTITFAFFIYINRYFNFNVNDGFNLVSARVMKDLVIISSIPYYIEIFILLIRTIGIDLNNFGFQEDKKFIESNEDDREEVEVSVGFDKAKFNRKIKFYIRNFKYFFKEHKYSLILTFFLTIFITGFITYKFFYIDNRIYSMNESFKSNNYQISVKHAYLTDKDYAGNYIGEDGRNFIIAEVEIKNLLNSSREFDIEKMMLYVDNDFYVPTTRYNDSFKDLGNVYKNVSIKAKETVSYILVYEINAPKSNSNFLFKYQNVLSSNKLIRIKARILNISEFKIKGDYKYSDSVSIPINENKTLSFKLTDFSINDSINYRYQSCDSNNICPIYQDTVSKSGKKILYTKVYLNDTSREDFLSFVNNYGKIRYLVNGTYMTVPVKFAVTKNYKGNYLYLEVPSDVVNATSIDLYFTIRTYQYFYNLKGE